MKVLRLSKREALWACSDLLNPTELLEMYHEKSRERPLPIHLQYEQDGVNVTAACLRTVWRYMLFAGRTGGKKVDLRNCAKGTPGQRLYRFNKEIMSKATTTDQIPECMRRV